MRRRLAGALPVLGVCVVLSAALCAVSLSPQAAALLQELSVSDANAQNSFFDVIWDGSPYIAGGQQVFKAAAPAAKVRIVRGLAGMLKAYTRSADFKTRYAEYLDANRPRPSSERVKSATEQDAEAAAAIKEMEANIKNMPPELQKQMEETVKQMKAQQEDLQKNAEYQSMRDSAARQAQADQEREYQERLAAFAAAHPTNPDVLIASRLREFLALSADVNYDARLVKQGSLLRFEDPALEAKPAEWKLCFRAGREATEAARAFATDWLKSLPSK